MDFYYEAELDYIQPFWDDTNNVLQMEKHYKRVKFDDPTEGFLREIRTKINQGFESEMIEHLSTLNRKGVFPPDITPPINES